MAPAWQRLQLIGCYANRKAIVKTDPPKRTIEQAHFGEPETPILTKRAAPAAKENQQHANCPLRVVYYNHHPPPVAYYR